MFMNTTVRLVGLSIFSVSPALTIACFCLINRSHHRTCWCEVFCDGKAFYFSRWLREFELRWFIAQLSKRISLFIFTSHGAWVIHSTRRESVFTVVIFTLQLHLGISQLTQSLVVNYITNNFLLICTVLNDFGIDKFTCIMYFYWKKVQLQNL